MSEAPLRVMVPDNWDKPKTIGALQALIDELDGETEPLHKALANPLPQEERARARNRFLRMQQMFRQSVAILYGEADDVCKTVHTIEQAAGIPAEAKTDLGAMKQRTLRRTRALINRQFATAYERAFELGLRAGGAGRSLADNELTIIRKQRLQENKFSGNFLTDMEHREGKMDYSRRADLYGNALEEMYWQGYLYADLSADRYVKWEMRHSVDAGGNWGGGENCVDCAVLSGDLEGLSDAERQTVEHSGRIIGGRWGIGVYQARELANMDIAPQSGKLACTTNCRCKLVQADRPATLPVKGPVTFASLKPKHFTGTSRDEKGKIVVEREHAQDRRKRYARDAKKLEHRHVNRKPR